MARHPDSSAFTRYLQNTITDLVEPLETVAWAIWKEGDDSPDAYAMIRFELDWVGKHFASRDKRISDLEAAFLEDIAVFLGEEGYDDLSDRTLSEIAQKQFIKDSALYDQISVPEPVVYLQIHDATYGTDYATVAKSMFFRFANAVTKADGTVSPQEQAALAAYKELFFNYRLDEQIEEQTENQEHVRRTDDLPSKAGTIARKPCQESNG